MPENSENDPFCDEKLALNFKRTDDMIETRQNLEIVFFREKYSFSKFSNCSGVISALFSEVLGASGSFSKLSETARHFKTSENDVEKTPG